MPTTSKLKAYLNRPNNINRRRALEEMLPLIQEAYQNVSLNNIQGKTIIGADQTWPEIQHVFSEQYSELISQLSMLEYFRLFTLFDYLSDTGTDTIQHMPHGDFCQAVAQIIGLATPHLAKKAIPDFVTTTNHHIGQFIRWGTKQCRQEVVQATHDLAQQLTTCRDDFIRSYTQQKKGANEDGSMIGYVLTYRDKTKEIIQSSAAAQALSTHRDWQGTIGNVMIALTGIGLIALAIKAAYSKATTGQVSLFFDTHATQKTEKLGEKLILASK